MADGRRAERERAAAERHPSSSRPTHSSRPRQHRPHPRPRCRRCRAASREPEAGDAQGRPRVPKRQPRPAAVAGKCRRAGSRLLKPTCAAGPRKLTAEPARAAARAPPGGRDFDFKERKEGRKDNSQLPLPPSRSGGRAGPCPGRRRPRPGRRDFPGSPATRIADCEFAAPGSWFLQALPEAERRSPSLRREESPASSGPRARPAPLLPRALRPRRWMA